MHDDLWIGKFKEYHEASSGVATGGGGGRGQSATPNSEKFAKFCEKEGKIQEILGEKRKNQEENAEIGKGRNLLCPFWQIGLATLLEANSWF